MEYVIYKENGIIKGTPLENYTATIMNARLVTRFTAFKTPEECKDYLQKYCETQANIIIVDIDAGQKLFKVDILETVQYTQYIAATDEDAIDTIDGFDYDTATKQVISIESGVIEYD